jgi:Tol biopolymer transport system component/tRNA A-37 threonylcarbamoyl transferase component Bud32
VDIGTKLGPYEIRERLGAGGMGVVYKARDTRLDRMVAVKVLSADKVGDAERKRRFIQEAKAASALNHPNIVVIYDIGNEAGTDYMAMELVPGRPLDQLILRNGMRIGEILRYSTQVADALAKAHAAGIVHRDLKPANLMVTPGGQVKVLDFGLAKLMQSPEPASEETSAFDGRTADGVVLGTSAYMSPEQAEGLQVDGRSDLFSFGTVLYEMVTGRRAFVRDTQLRTLSAIANEEPKPASEIRADLPRDLIRVMTRCLRKDPSRRYQNAADLKVDLEELSAEWDTGKSAPLGPSQRSHRAGRRRRWIGACLAVLFGGVGTVWYFLGRSAESGTSGAVLRPVPLTSYSGIQRDASFSPDGSQVVFSWNGESQNNYGIYLKLVGSGPPLRLTLGHADDFSPKWSPDGQSIAFLRRVSEDTIDVMLVPPLGGLERKLARIYSQNLGPGVPETLSWSHNSKSLIVSAKPAPNALNRLSAISVETGESHTLTDPPQGMYDVEPALSPDGTALAFARSSGQNIMGLMVLDVSEDLQPRGALRALRTGNQSAWEPAWSPDGKQILFVSGSSTATESVYRVPASGSGSATPLVWAGPGTMEPAVAPQGKRLVYQHSFEDTNLWRVTLGANTAPEKVIASTFREVSPQYSPDGRHIAFHSDRDGTVQIWTCLANGTQCLQITQMTGTTTGTPRWSPDGQQISFDSNTGGHWSIYAINADGGRPRQLTGSSGTNINASWSQDGRWIYFSSNRGGQFDIWKIPTQGGEPVQVTHSGGTAPLESADGKDLYFVKQDGAEGVWKTPVQGGTETQVLKQPIYRYNFAITQQGMYFTTPRRPDGESLIQYLDFSTGAVSEIVKTDKTIDLGLAVSPDHKSLLFAQVDYVGSNLMMAEGFQ